MSPTRLCPDGHRGSALLSRRVCRRGFTLIEILIVITVILIIAGLTVPAVNAIRTRMDRTATNHLCLALANAIKTYGSDTINVPPKKSGDPWVVRRLWDFNGDGFLDGNPQAVRSVKHLGPLAINKTNEEIIFTADQKDEAARCGYLGPAAMFETLFPNRASDGAIRDRWGTILRISYGMVYGGIGIWSEGPDGVPGTDDDICSWKDAP